MNMQCTSPMCAQHTPQNTIVLIIRTPARVSLVFGTPKRFPKVVAEVYSRLVDLVLRLTNEHIPAEAKAGR